MAKNGVSLTPEERRVAKALLARKWRNQDIQALINIGRKAFDRSAVIGPVHPVSLVGHIGKGGDPLERQRHGPAGLRSRKLIWSVSEIIAILSRSIELKPGDLIMTATPEGVGALSPAGVCTVHVESLGEITTTIRRAHDLAASQFLPVVDIGTAAPGTKPEGVGIRVRRLPVAP